MAHATIQLRKRKAHQVQEAATENDAASCESNQETKRIRRAEEIGRRKGVKDEAFRELLKVRATNGGRSKWGDISMIVTKYCKAGYKFVTRGYLNYKVSCYNSKKHCRHLINIPNNVSLDRGGESSGISSITVGPSLYSGTTHDPETSEEQVLGMVIDAPVTPGNVGGRRKGITSKSKKDDRKRLLIAREKAACLCAAEKERAKLNGEDVSVARLKDIIYTVQLEENLPRNSIPYETIRSRIKRNNLSGKTSQSTPPLEKVEPLIVEYCQRCAQIGYPLTKDQVITLAEDLIDKTEYFDSLKNCKEQKKITVTATIDSSRGWLGDRWYWNFLKRHEDKIRRGQGKIRDVKRFAWCTYQNFENMYNCVYEQMVQGKVAIELSSEKYFDINGNIVTDPTHCFGRPTKYQVVRPEQIIFVDECGCNTSQEDDGHVGGQLFVMPNDGSATGLLSSMHNMHFTVLGFTSGTGQPVMCAVILKSEQDVSKLPYSWRYGIDVSKHIHEDDDDQEFFRKNCGDGQAMQGGPKCIFNGQEVHCFVACSPSASITSQLLANMLRYMDQCCLFDRRDGNKPFLLLDGHHSRLEVPFLEYVNGDGHEWTCCLGVPYGTHLWQVADSPYLNGNFKTALTNAKRRLFEIKAAIGKNFEPTDIMPLVSSAWQESFGVCSNGIKAIATRGWGPLNYYVLDDPLLHRTNHCDSTSTNNGSDTSHQSSVDLAHVNVSYGAGRTLLDKLMLDASKDKIHMDALEKRKSEMDTIRNKIERLKRLTRISSGQLASISQYHVGPEVYNEIQHRLEQDQAKQKARDCRKDQRVNALALRYLHTRQKMHENPTLVLNTDDLKTLLQYHKRRDDSPIKTKAKDLRQQWERRKDRLESSPTSLLLSHTISSSQSRPQATNEGELIDLQYNNEEDQSSQLQNDDNTGITRESINNTSNFDEMPLLSEHDCVRTLFSLGDNHYV
jgi:hypothetical protein